MYSGLDAAGSGLTALFDPALTGPCRVPSKLKVSATLRLRVSTPNGGCIIWGSTEMAISEYDQQYHSVGRPVGG